MYEYIGWFALSKYYMMGNIFLLHTFTHQYFFFCLFFFTKFPFIFFFARFSFTWFDTNNRYSKTIYGCRRRYLHYFIPIYDVSQQQCIHSLNIYNIYVCIGIYMLFETLWYWNLFDLLANAIEINWTNILIMIIMIMISCISCNSYTRLL